MLHLLIGPSLLDSKLFVSRLNGKFPDLYERLWDGVEWTWIDHGRPDDLDMEGAPGAAMLDSKLFVVVKDGSLRERQWREDLGRWAWESHGRPQDLDIKYGPGAAMMDSKLFVVTEDGSLWERNWRDDLDRWAWEDHGRPNDRKIVSAPGAAMLDSKLFVVDQDGSLWERNWRDDLGRWAWEDHGRPNDRKIVSAPGAAMLDSKLFVVDQDGSLWERNWRDDLGRWAWEDHGRPNDRKIVSAPGAAMLDSKLFVVDQDGSLWERQWRDDLDRWAWESHGQPPESKLDGDPGAAMAGDKLFVAGKDDHLYERFWTGSVWKWVDHGTACHDTSAHVIGAPGTAPKWTVAVMGDGYAEEDMDRYRNDVDKLVVKAFELDELGRGLHAFRVVRIDLVSPVSGVTEEEFDPGEDPGSDDDNLLSRTFRFSRLGFTINGLWSQDWLEPGEATLDLIGHILSRFAPDATQTLVVLNSNMEGASSLGEVLAFSRKESKFSVAHEMGHSLFDLGDEYHELDLTFPAGNTAPEPNLSEQPEDWDDLKWKDLVAPGAPLPTRAANLPEDWDEERDVGAFEGGRGDYAKGLFHPSLQCRMHEVKDAWCRVCGREITRRLGEIP